MIAKAAVFVQQVAGIGVPFKTQTGHIAKLSYLLVETGISRIRIVVIAVVIAGIRIHDIPLRQAILEIGEAPGSMDDGLDTGLEFGIAVQQRIGIIGLQGEIVTIAKAMESLQ